MTTKDKATKSTRLKYVHAKQWVKDKGVTRMQASAYIAIITSLLLLAMFPHQLGTVLAKVNLLSIGAWAGYWIDRAAFPYSRPHQWLDGSTESMTSQLRRAVIIGTAMLAMALAL